MEFALDNIQILKQRQDKLQVQQQGSRHDAKNVRQSFESHKLDAQPNMLRKRTFRGDIASSNTSGTTHENAVEHDVLEGAGTEEGKFNKRHKPSPSRTKENKFDSKKNNKQEAMNLPKGRKPDGGQSLDAVSEAVAHKSKPLEEVDERRSKRKLQDRTQQPKEDFSSNRKKTRKNKDPLGRDTEDKLDMLIKQYTSKFSQRGPDKADGENQGPPRQLRRWFQS